MLKYIYDYMLKFTILRLGSSLMLTQSFNANQKRESDT